MDDCTRRCTAGHSFVVPAPDRMAYFGVVDGVISSPGYFQLPQLEYDDQRECHDSRCVVHRCRPRCAATRTGYDRRRNAGDGDHTTRRGGGGPAIHLAVVHLAPALAGRHLVFWTAGSIIRYRNLFHPGLDCPMAEELAALFRLPGACQPGCGFPELVAWYWPPGWFVF